MLRNITRFRSGILVSLFLLLATLTGSAQEAGETRRILVIQSYHPAFPTHYRQVEGIRSVLQSPAYEVDFEHLDSKRFSSPEHYAYLTEWFQRHLASLPAYHGIITADDNALRFVLQHRETLFSGVPLVFCSVNDVALAQSAAASPDITGVVEAVSMEETLALMEQLLPGLREVYAIVDSTNSGQGDLKSYFRAASVVPGIALRELSLEQMSFPRLEERLRALPEDSAVLLLSAYTDSTGRTVTFWEGLQAITASLERPLFHLWYHGMGQGILGGKVISQYEQGRTAATMMRKIMSGEATAAALSLVSESPNRYIFDREELTRYDIPLRRVPRNSQLINRKPSLLREYRSEVLVGLAVITLLVVVVVLLVRNNLRRRETERELLSTQSRFMTVFDYSPVPLWEEDFSEVKSILDALGINDEEKLRSYLVEHPRFVDRCAREIGIVRSNRKAREVFDLDHEEGPAHHIVESTLSTFRDELVALYGGATQFSTETRHRNRNGDLIHTQLHISIAPGSEHTWDKVFISIQDITELKQVTDELRRSLTQKESLLREIHHRVKNNLTMVISLLNLQHETVGDEDARRLLEESQARIYAMASFHERLYQNTALDRIDLQEYFEGIGSYLIQMYAARTPVPVHISYEIAPLSVDTDRLIPLGLIATEALTNIFKHAVPTTDDPRITVKITARDTRMILTISDNGKTTDDSISTTPQSATVGMSIMTALAQQLKGTFTTETGAGTRVIIDIPLLGAG